MGLLYIAIIAIAFITMLYKLVKSNIKHTDSAIHVTELQNTIATNTVTINKLKADMASLKTLLDERNSELHSLKNQPVSKKKSK